MLAPAVLLSLVLLLQASVVPLASSAPTDSKPCTTPRIRKEWRTLTVNERSKYIEAVNCMMTNPAKYKSSFSVVQNRYDDFVALHANSTGGGLKLDGFKGWEELSKNPFRLGATMRNGIHGTGAFLPWHRYAIQVWEDALVSECGWTGGQPYWDWYLDNPDSGGSFLESPLFDPVSGFGGNGKKVNITMPTKIFGVEIATIAKLIPGFEMPVFGGTGGGCLLDGPFKNRTVRIGPMGQMTPNNTRCLTRNFNAQIAKSSSSKVSLAQVLSAKTFNEFTRWMEAGNPQFHGFTPGKGLNFTNHGDMHDIGHGGIGGEMTDLFNSANDPLFWMHHTGMDRIWSLWQEQDPKRVHDGDTRRGIFDVSPMTLESPLWMGVFAPDRRVGDLFDTLNRDGKGFLCYKYEGMPIEKYTT